MVQSKKIKPEFAAIAKQKDCDHVNVKNKTLGPNTEIFVCFDCGAVVDPARLPSAKRAPDTSFSPLMPMRFVFSKDIDDGDLRFVESIDVTEKMIVNLKDVPAYMPLGGVRPGDRVKIYRQEA